MGIDHTEPPHRPHSLPFQAAILKREAAAIFLKHAHYSDTFRPLKEDAVLKLKEKAEQILKESR